jgi:hypothetical protein
MELSKVSPKSQNADGTIGRARRFVDALDNPLKPG